MTARKQYRNHKFDTHEDCLAEMNQEKMTRDDALLNRLIKHSIQYLDNHNINNQYESVIELFKNSGFQAQMISNMINEFKNYINKLKEKNNNVPYIDWISIRSFKKAKLVAKNIVLNRIIHEYPIYFIDFLKEYIRENDGFNIDFFFNELQNKINRLQSISNNVIIQANTLNTDNNTDPNNSNLNFPLSLGNVDDENDDEDEYFVDNEIHQILQF